MTDSSQPGLGAASSAPFECHSSADLVRWVANKIENIGGRVFVGPEYENLCRRARPGEIPDNSNIIWVIEAQGLPNLIHEFLHALFLGHLADDHGFDYGEIPLDMGRADHRRHLWEELACCGVSAAICAPIHSQPERFMREWFIEQFEIQGVFHGLEDNLDAFVSHIDRQLSTPEYQLELQATVDRGYELLGAAMLEVGGPRDLPRCDLLEMWRDYRSLRAAETKRTLAGSHSSP